MSTNVTTSEIAATIKYLKAAAKRGDVPMFDSNANYLRSAIDALILQEAKAFEEPVLPLYAVTIFSKITQTEASFDVRASSENAAVRAIRNRGFNGKNHIVRSVGLVLS